MEKVANAHSAEVKKVDVVEHVFGKRKSITFTCNGCKKSDHFDGLTAKLNK